MTDFKKTISTLRKFLSEDGATAHFLYHPGPPPHIEFGRSKITASDDTDVIGTAVRQGDTVFLAPKTARLLKAPAVKDLNKALKNKLEGVTFQLGDAPGGATSTDESAAQADAATTSTTAGNPDVALVMARIANGAGRLLSRTDLPPQLGKIQAALNKAGRTSEGDPRQLATAFQKLRSAAMAYDAEREAAQNASTSSTSGTAAQGQQDPFDEDLPPLPPTPHEIAGAYGNIPGGVDAAALDPGPLPPTPEDTAANYGDLLVGQGISATGYDDTYQDLDLVPEPQDATAAVAGDAADDGAQDGPYGRVTEEQMEEYRQQSAQELVEIEDMFNDTIKATFDKLDDKLEGTPFARDTAKYANIQRGLLRFQEIAEGQEPDHAHLRHIMRELRQELVAMIKAVKARSAR